ncbi:hypothetical protein TNCT_641641 [Trichonephila clavata]|uniref:Uncharacterized protein n=1 Tax=Trichonephila clavata TaxID=2740835 RepID=A0A8X6F279_TRICU|nr:hypothetical protein TNCT_641641 [Trichonephila clavata]
MPSWPFAPKIKNNFLRIRWIRKRLHCEPFRRKSCLLHNRLVSFPCAAKAARTLAMNWNRTPRLDSKKVIQCKEDKPMDKLDEKQLLAAIDKLLEECDELMDQYPGEETPLEAMDKPLMDNSMEKIDKSNEPLEQDKLPMDDTIEQCDGEGCHEVLCKLLEQYPLESLDKCLDQVDKRLVENTKKLYSDETMKRGNETMECNVEEIIKLDGAMECCEEMLDNDKFIYVE